MITGFQCDCSDEAILARMAEVGELNPPDPRIEEALFADLDIWRPPEDPVPDSQMHYVAPRRLEHMDPTIFERRLDLAD